MLVGQRAAGMPRDWACSLYCTAKGRGRACQHTRAEPASIGICCTRPRVPVAPAAGLLILLGQCSASCCSNTGTRPSVGGKEPAPWRPTSASIGTRLQASEHRRRPELCTGCDRGGACFLGYCAPCRLRLGAGQPLSAALHRCDCLPARAGGDWPSSCPVKLPLLQQIDLSCGMLESAAETHRLGLVLADWFLYPVFRSGELPHHLLDLTPGRSRKPMACRTLASVRLAVSFAFSAPLASTCPGTTRGLATWPACLHLLCAVSNRKGSKGLTPCKAAREQQAPSPAPHPGGQRSQLTRTWSSTAGSWVTSA